MTEMDFMEAMTASTPETKETAAVAPPEESRALAIVMPTGTSLMATLNSLIPYQEVGRELVAQANKLVINSVESQKTGTEIGLRAKRHRLEVEAIKKNPVYLAAESLVKETRAICNSTAAPFSTVEETVKAKIKVFQKEQILEGQRKEAREREAARIRQAELDAEAKALREEAELKAQAAREELEAREAVGDIDAAEKASLERTIAEETEAAKDAVAPTIATPVTEKPSTVVRTDIGSSYVRRRFMGRMVDEALVPDKYKVVDMKLVQKDIDAGERNIPGIVIEEDINPVLRG
jgi:hypothetical protein